MKCFCLERDACIEKEFAAIEDHIQVEWSRIILREFCFFTFCIEVPIANIKFSEKSLAKAKSLLNFLTERFDVRFLVQRKAASYPPWHSGRIARLIAAAD
ncbi:hypothetical protein [Roseimaritima multifibrata]|uniref:hypothetical protein n=1 Tax=Roseimaritima multifibrata TaxID=1930274 RepID=UPI001C54C7AF|nr:hypothetical protein [Roseimaritima multifibrata]